MAGFDFNAEATAERMLDNLLALVTDPVACTARRAELKADAEASQKLVDEANAINATAADHHTDAEAALADAREHRDAAESNLRAAADKERQNVIRSAALDEREAAVNTRESNVKYLAQRTGEQANTLAAREDAVKAREDAVTERLTRAEALEADYAQRIEAAQALMSRPAAVGG